MVRRWAPVWAPAYAVLSALMLVAAVLSFRDDSADWQGWLFFVMYAVLGFGIAWTCRREGVRVDGQGMTFVRVAGSQHLPWPEIADVTTRRDGTTWPTWRVVLSDGRVLDTRIKRTRTDLGAACARHRR